MPLKPKEAAMRLGVSYPTLKKWIYSGKLHTVTTPGGHHRIAEAELAIELQAVRRERNACAVHQMVGTSKLSASSRLSGGQRTV